MAKEKLAIDRGYRYFWNLIERYSTVIKPCWIQNVNNTFPFFTEQMAGNHSKLTDKYIAGRGRALKEFARRSLKAEVRNYNKLF